jgi:hypothetical protein
MASLIKYTQAAITDVAGNAVKGTMTDGIVTVSNGDNTGVASWKYELLYVPPGSAIPLTTQGPGLTPTFTFPQPDRPGSYRVRLTTTDASGNTDVDIRCFCVPFTAFGLIIPPFQGNPIPLPMTGAGSKPNEMNLGGQSLGYDGGTDDNYKMLYRALLELDRVLNLVAPQAAVNTASGVLTFAKSTRKNWTGGTTLNLTYSAGAAVDGAEEVMFIPAGLLTLTISSDLDPTGTVVYEFDGTGAYEFSATFRSNGPHIVSVLRKVTDL